jgi:hypothetical protein
MRKNKMFCRKHLGMPHIVYVHVRPERSLFPCVSVLLTT